MKNKKILFYYYFDRSDDTMQRVAINKDFIVQLLECPNNKEYTDIYTVNNKVFTVPHSISEVCADIEQ